MYGFAKDKWFSSESAGLLGTMAFGASAACVATTVTYPFDFMRTIFAAQGVPPVYTSFRALIHSTWKSQGVAGFYRGILPACSQVMPYMGLNFALYEKMRAQNYSPTTSGAFAGLLSKLVVYPLDTVKKRMQMQTLPRASGAVPMYTSSLDCVRTMCRDEGVLALYRGTVPSVAKAIVASSSTFTVYEYVLHHVLENSALN